MVVLPKTDQKDICKDIHDRLREDEKYRTEIKKNIDKLVEAK